MLLQTILEENIMSRLQEIAENLDRYLIGLDEPFQFKCRGCGKCCKNREDILLTSRDLFRIAKHFEKTPAEIVEEYCECYIGPSSRIPLVRLLPRGPAKACPFLADKRCQVHTCKPVVCALFPIGRIQKFSKEDGAPEELPGYILQEVECGSRKKITTVRQWLEKFNIPVEDIFYAKWTMLISQISMAFAKLHPHLSERALQALQAKFGQLLYLEYNIAEEFLEQFLSNAEQVEESIGYIQSFYKEEIGGEDGED